MLFGIIVCTTLYMDQRKQRRELSEEVRKKIIDKHSKGKAKFKVHGTVANLPGHDRKRKIDPRLNRKIVRMVEKEPKITAKEIQAELQCQGTSVSDHTTRRFFSQSGLHGRRPMRTPLLKEKHKKASLEFAKMPTDKPQYFWENVLRTDESKLELLGKSHQLYVHRRKNMFWDSLLRLAWVP